MIQNPQPLARRSRKTILIALLTLLLAGTIGVLSRMGGSHDTIQQTTVTPSSDAGTRGSSSVLAIDDPTSLGAVSQSTRPVLADSVAIAGTRRLSILNRDTQAKQAVVRPRVDRSPVGVATAILLLVFGAGLAIWLKRTRRDGSVHAVIESVARLQLPHSQELRLIRVRDQELLVGCTQSSLSILHKFDGEITVANGNDSSDQRTVSSIASADRRSPVTISTERIEPLRDRIRSAEDRQSRPRIQFVDVLGTSMADEASLDEPPSAGSSITSTRPSATQLSMQAAADAAAALSELEATDEI